jgi:hypothetical protein
MPMFKRAREATESVKEIPSLARGVIFIAIMAFIVAIGAFVMALGGRRYANA